MSRRRNNRVEEESEGTQVIHRVGLYGANSMCHVAHLSIDIGYVRLRLQMSGVVHPLMKHAHYENALIARQIEHDM